MFQSFLLYRQSMSSSTILKLRELKKAHYLNTLHKIKKLKRDDFIKPTISNPKDENKK